MVRSGWPNSTARSERRSASWARNLVKPPRGAESRINMECKVHQVVHVSPRPLGGRLVMGEVLRFHVADVLFSDFKIDQEQLRAIGRLGGPSYVRTTDRFDMPRAKYEHPK